MSSSVEPKLTKPSFTYVELNFTYDDFAVAYSSVNDICFASRLFIQIILFSDSLKSRTPKGLKLKGVNNVAT
jgi:hypothetical protein